MKTRGFEIVKGYENSRLSRDLILAALSELDI